MCPRGAASSFHLIWQMPDVARSGWRVSKPGLVEVSAVLEVLTEPSVPALYFWALQVDFEDRPATFRGRRVWGGTHTGLQWNRRYPGYRAVNWGGYASAERGGAVLPGSASTLPGFADDPNTLAYPWEPERPYRFRVYRSPDTPGSWRAEVTDVESGVATAIRDLHPAGAGPTAPGYLTTPMVWSEVFAECEDPSVVVRWSGLEARDESGAVVAPEAVQVNYQSPERGGCPNTSVALDDQGILQVTNTPRGAAQGTRVSVP